MSIVDVEVVWRSSFGFGGYAPTTDGEMKRYFWRARRRQLSSYPTLVYVNGMLTDGRAHRDAAGLFSVLSGSYVYGVYNSTTQSRVRNPAVRSAIQAFGDIRECLEDYIDVQSNRVTSANPATLALVELLSHELQNVKRLVLAAHSQGNLITSAALHILLRGDFKLPPMDIIAIASPTANWPQALRKSVLPISYADDPIPQLRRILSPMFHGSRDSGNVGFGTVGFNLENPLENHAVTSYLTRNNSLSRTLSRLGFSGSLNPGTGGR